MKNKLLKVSPKWIFTVGLVAVAVTGVVTRNRWLPALTSWVDTTLSAFHSDSESASGHAHSEHDAHADHDHGAHAAHNEETSLKLSDQALRNIGLSKETIQPIRLQTFRRSITLPALVVERPGRTQLQVATPMTGVITHVHAVKDAAVEPGTLLFRIRLTHEDLVNAQIEFVRLLGELDVEEREIKRLRDVTRSGAIPGKLLLEREYARDKLAALLRAQQEALRLHGLSENQVDQIAKERRLLRELQVFAPSKDHHQAEEFDLTQTYLSRAAVRQTKRLQSQAPTETPLILKSLGVHKGQSVAAGETLCALADYQELFIEGMAFEQDISQLRRASENGWTVDAVFHHAGGATQLTEGLRIAYLANEIDRSSRALHFYVHLPNEITADRRENDIRYIEWKYLPGQRLQLRIPVEEWSDQIVLPVEAVAREGAEWYVFQQNGSRFDRVPVHVKYRDQYSVVIENDGSIFPGDVVALRGAHQMQMALKNKSGGAVDPHAGHNH